MSSTLLKRAAHGYPTLYTLPKSSPNVIFTRAASLTSAIGKGLRKSAGVGFRGREKPERRDAGRDTVREERKPDKYGRTMRIPGPERTRPPIVKLTSPEFRSGLVPIRAGKRIVKGSAKDDKKPRLTRAARFNSPEFSFGNKAIAKREALRDDRGEENGFDDRNNKKERRFERRASEGISLPKRALDLEEYSGNGGTRSWEPRPAHRSQRTTQSDRMALSRNPDGARHNPSRASFLTKSEYDDRRVERTSVFGVRNPIRKAASSEDPGTYLVRPRQSNGSDERQNTLDPMRRLEREQSFRPGRKFDLDEPENSRGIVRRSEWRDQSESTYRNRQERNLGSEDQPQFREQARSDEPKIQRWSGPPAESNNSQSTYAGYHSRRQDDSPAQFTINTTSPKFDKNVPISIPYTTPASVFLYGTSVVKAALKSSHSHRRKLYKLYVYSGENRENLNVVQDIGMEILAKRLGIPVSKVGGDWLRTMDKMSAGRPHNGYILEASPLPKLPVISLGKYSDEKESFGITLDYQSKEEADINGTPTEIYAPRSRETGARMPLVLLLDSIIDPGNVGGIIRTASFLGVTAIAISTYNSVTFTPVVLKASAGASENMTFFNVKNPAKFLKDSKASGWKVFGAAAPEVSNKQLQAKQVSVDELDQPLKYAPGILMLGNEGDGLRWLVRKEADVEVTIPGDTAVSVDSLNVSVAAGILCSAFMKAPQSKDLLHLESHRPAKAGREVAEPEKMF